MVPDAEMHTLLLDIEDAVRLARAGHLVDAYDCLLAGLRRARQSRAAGQPWAGELVRRYQDTVETFTARYGVRMG